jgi:3-dehydroquinate synthase class II
MITSTVPLEPLFSALLILLSLKFTNGAFHTGITSSNTALLPRHQRPLTILEDGSKFWESIKKENDIIDVPPVRDLEIWCDCRSSEKIPEQVSFDAVLAHLNSDLQSLDRNLGNVGKPMVAKYLVDENKYDQNHERILRNGQTAGILVNITQGASQQTALSAMGSVGWVLVRAEGSKGWRMSVADNLIGVSAAAQSGTKIAFVAEQVEDVKDLAEAFEWGVDAVIVQNDAPMELWTAALQAKKKREGDESDSVGYSYANDYMSGGQSAGQSGAQSGAGQHAVQTSEQRGGLSVGGQSGQIVAANDARPTSNQNSFTGDSEIIPGTCWRMSASDGVVADRVCIDFVRALEPHEGCWIGSSSMIMTMILSEASLSSYAPSRPFRVNAGPVHSYVLLGDGVSTKYLCELMAGDEVLVSNALTGESRPVAVGRLKVESRPCVMIGLQGQIQEGNQRPAEGQIFLQNAETVRISAGGGEFVRVTDLQVASYDDTSKRVPILLKVSSAGTHVGGRYAGDVRER